MTTAFRKPISIVVALLAFVSIGWDWGGPGAECSVDSTYINQGK